MNIYGIKENLQYKQSASLSNIAFRGDNFIKRGWNFVTGKDSYEKSFMPTTSLITEDLDYVVEVRSFVVKNGYNKQQEKSLYNKLYQSLKTNEEREIFRRHFGKYLTEEKRQQPTQSKPQGTTQPRQQGNTRQSSQAVKQGTPYTITECEQQTAKPVTQRTTSNPKTTQVVTQKETTAVKPEVKTITKESLLEEFERIEKEDVPNFVVKIANGTRDTKYNLVEIYNELWETHKELLENDPQTLYRKKLFKNEELKQKIEKEIEEKFRQEGRKYNSTNVVEERIKVFKQMEKDAGFENYAPETLRLGQKLYVLEKQMKEQNVSFVPKAPDQFGDEVEQWQYIQTALKCGTNNIASTMDALSVYEKYALKDLSPTDNYFMLVDLSSCVSVSIDYILDKSGNEYRQSDEDLEKINTILNKFIDIFSENALPGKESCNQGTLTSVVSEFHQYMSKENVIKFIDEAKKISFDQQAYYCFKNYFSSAEFKQGITDDDLPEIQSHIWELGSAVNELPKKELNLGVRRTEKSKFFGY